MPTIPIDEDAWRELQRRAEPFVDTPNDVIRRLLGLAKRGADSGDADISVASVRKGERRTPDREFRIPILEALTRLGGRARPGEVVNLVGEIMKPTLKDIDYTQQGAGQIRYRESTSFERLHMSQESPPLVVLPERGWWEISQAGRDYLKRHRNGQSG